jgi:hypothetical protein
MYWRIGNAYRRAAPEENKAAFEKVVKHGPPPGLPAFKGKVPIAWCLLTQLPRLFLAFAVSMKGSASFSIKVGVRSKIVTNEYQHLYCIE